MNKINMILIAIVFLIILFVLGVVVVHVNDSFENQDTKVEETNNIITLYYYNPAQDKDAAGNVLCSRDGLVGVMREIKLTSTPIHDAIRLLLRGELTQDERQRGITTEFPLSDVELKGANLNNGVLTLEFVDPQNKTSGGSCRAGILWFQIEATAKQFSGVREVRFIPEELFQP
jgi:spore germination protein GerM